MVALHSLLELEVVSAMPTRLVYPCMSSGAGERRTKVTCFVPHAGLGKDYALMLASRGAKVIGKLHSVTVEAVSSHPAEAASIE